MIRIQSRVRGILIRGKLAKTKPYAKFMPSDPYGNFTVAKAPNIVIYLF